MNKIILSITVLVFMVSPVLAIDFQITPSEFNETAYINSRFNRTLSFKNNALQPASVHIPDEIWFGYSEPDFILGSGEEKNITFFINLTGSTGTYTKIIPVAVNTTNETDTKDVVFNFNILPPNAHLVLDLFTVDFVIETGSSELGVLRLTNNGNVSAFDISFEASSDWIAFSDDHFDLGINESKIISFNVTVPHFSDTNQTNQTYVIPVEAEAFNSYEVKGNLNIFVPYKRIESNVTDTDFLEFLEQLRMFCEVFPTSPYCDLDPDVVYQNVTEYIYLPYQVNISEDELNAYELKKGEVERLEGLFNMLGTKLDNLSATNTQLQSVLNYISGKIEENEAHFEEIEDKVHSQVTIGGGLWIAVIILVIFFLAILGLYYYKTRVRPFTYNG